MITAAILTIVLIAALAHGLRGGRDGALILRRPYNNRYNAAAGAREDAF